MWVVEHFPLCPFSRKVRLVLMEKRVSFKLHEIKPKRRPAGIQMGHTGGTPTLYDGEAGIGLENSNAICEYLEETVPLPSVLPGTPEQRAEIRRMVAWVEESFYPEAVWPLVRSRVTAFNKATS